MEFILSERRKSTPPLKHFLYSFRERDILNMIFLLFAATSDLPSWMEVNANRWRRKRKIASYDDRSILRKEGIFERKNSQVRQTLDPSFKSAFFSHNFLVYLRFSISLSLSLTLFLIASPPLLSTSTTPMSLNSEAKRLSLSLESMDLIFQGAQELSILAFKRKMMDIGFRYTSTSRYVFECGHRGRFLGDRNSNSDSDSDSNSYSFHLNKLSGTLHRLLVSTLPTCPSYSTLPPSLITQNTINPHST